MTCESLKNETCFMMNWKAFIFGSTTTLHGLSAGVLSLKMVAVLWWCGSGRFPPKKAYQFQVQSEGWEMQLSGKVFLVLSPSTTKSKK